MKDIRSAASILTQARLNAGLTQRQLAERVGTSQPAIARLEAGLVSPTLDTVKRVAAAAGYELRVELAPLPGPDPVIEAYKRHVDRSLLRENLRRTVDERLQSLDDLRRFGDELQRAVRDRGQAR